MPDSNPIELQGSIWLTIAGQNFGSSHRIALLQQIAQHGSITQAAKALKISYKAAWDAIDTMNNLAGEPLLERVAGGKGGGGSRLTTRGQQLVNNFQQIEQVHQNFIRQLNSQASELADDLLLLRKMQMKISARNQFAGIVRQIRSGSVNDDILLDIAQQQLTAQITCESTHQLKLAPGVEVVALIKASAVMLALSETAAKFSAENQLTGQIQRLQPGAVNTEVVIELPAGGTLAAMISNQSCQDLDLHLGKSVTALFKASDVLLACNY